MLPTLSLTKIHDLILTQATAPGRDAHFSAASGLVCVQSFMYVIADDELHLAVFRRDNAEAGELVRLVEGILPDRPADRKKLKPDFEALTFLPPCTGYPNGALIVLGSGSRKNRRAGLLLPFDDHGAIAGKPVPIDLSSAYALLEHCFEELNIEGVRVRGEELQLFQRANRKHPTNAVVSLSLSTILPARDAPIVPPKIVAVELGDVGGVPLSFTDAAPLPDGATVFTAVAEDTGDSYNDGACGGAAIGVLTAQGTLGWIRRLDRPHKVEGVHAEREGDHLRLWLVTDADDPAVIASLYTVTVNAADGSQV